MRSNKYEKCTIQGRSVKDINCSEEYDIVWGKSMSYCRRQQFSRYAAVWWFLDQEWFATVLVLLLSLLLVSFQLCPLISMGVVPGYKA